MQDKLQQISGMIVMGKSKKTNRTDAPMAGWFFRLPGLLLVSLWPCIVHLDRVRTYLENENWYPDAMYADDYFLHSKSMAFLILTIWMAAALCVGFIGRRDKKKSETAAARAVSNKKAGVAACITWNLPIVLAVAWFVLSLISSLASPYRRLSFAGIPESYETIPVLFGYLITFLYGRMLLQPETERSLLKKAAVAGGAVQGLIGFSQFFGHDFWASKAGRWLIFAGTGRDSSIARFGTDAFHRVYMSFYNPNYAAVYIMILLPFAVEGTMQWLRKLASDRAQKTGAAGCSRIAGTADHIYGILCILAAVLLTISMFGTGSKTGRGLLLVMIPVYLLIFTHISRKKKVSGAAVYAILLALLAAAALHSQGKNLFTGTLASAFPRQYAGTLRNVKMESGDVIFEFEEQNIRVHVLQENEAPTLYVYDADTGTPIRMELQEKTGRLAASDENWRLPEKCLTFEAVMQQAENGLQAHLIVWYRKAVPWHFIVSEKGEGLVYLNPVGKVSSIEKAPQVWESADDRILTGRMYIWKRTMPLLKNALFLGYGQESFPAVFPQNDYAGRANVGAGQCLEIITKPHNMYLQVFAGSGLPALICLLASVVVLLRQFFRASPDEENGENEKKTAPAIALICFLLSGLLYDSTIAVTPLICLFAGFL